MFRPIVEPIGPQLFITRTMIELPGRTTMPNQRPQDRTAFETWMSGELKQRFDDVLREALPAELAALLETGPRSS